MNEKVAIGGVDISTASLMSDVVLLLKALKKISNYGQGIDGRSESECVEIAAHALREYSQRK